VGSEELEGINIGDIHDPVLKHTEKNQLPGKFRFDIFESQEGDKYDKGKKDSRKGNKIGIQGGKVSFYQAEGKGPDKGHDQQVYHEAYRLIFNPLIFDRD
jgi:hypothetical protein